MTESNFGTRPANGDFQRTGAMTREPRTELPYNDEGQSSGQGDSSSGIQEKAMEKVSNVTGMASEKTSEITSKLSDSADGGVNRAAEGLEQAAVQLRERAEDGGGVQEKVGVRVADGLDKTSVYLRDHEAQEIWTDVEKFVKEHPMQAAIGAAVAGYVVAKVLK